MQHMRNLAQSFQPLNRTMCSVFFNSRPDVSGSTRSVYPGWTEQVFTVHFTLRSAVYLLYQELTDSCCCTPADASLFLFTHQCCNQSPKWKQVRLHTLKNTFSVHRIQTGGDQFFTMPQRNCLKYDLPPARRRPSQPPPLCHSWLLRLSTAVISLSAQLCRWRDWWGVRGRTERAPFKLDLFTYRGAALCSAARGYVADRVVLTSVSAAHRVAFPTSAAPLITQNHQVILR